MKRSNPNLKKFYTKWIASGDAFAMTIENNFTILNLVKSFLTSINFDSLPKENKNPCFVINKNLKFRRVFKMKKLIIILGLLLATSVAFGKPAYKTWKAGAFTSSWHEMEMAGRYLMLHGNTYSSKKRGGGNVVVASFLDTNQIDSGKVRVMVTMVVSEPLDYSVGKNMGFFISGTNYNIKVLLSNETFQDNRYMYYADFGYVDLEALRTGSVGVEQPYKFTGDYRGTTSFFYHGYQDEVLRRKEEVEKRAKENAELEARGGLNFYQYRDGLDNRYNALIKNYKEVYSGATGKYGVWSKKPAPTTATRFDVCLTIDYDADSKFWRDDGGYRNGHKVVDGIQFQLIIPQVVSYFVDVGTIYTEDGEYTLRYPFSFYNGQAHYEHGMSKFLYAFGVVMTPRVVKETGKFEYLNKMFSSGKPIYIEFVGRGIGSMKYRLTAQDIARVKDLLKFIKDLQGAF